MGLPDTLTTLRRPRLLVRAARKGLVLYRRDRDLRAILGAGSHARNVLARLTSEEADIERARRSDDATYSPARHIALLTALIAEARAHG